MKRVLLMVFAVLLLLVGCGKETDGMKFKTEYEGFNGEETASGKKYIDVNIDKDNIMKYSTIEEIIDIIEEGTGVIYLGYPQCPWCRNAVPALLEAADSTSLEEIYYLDMYDVRDRLAVSDDGEIIIEVQGNEKYKELLKVLDSVIDDYIIKDKDGNDVNTGEKRIYVPIVIFVKNGEIISTHANTVSSQVDPYVNLTSEESSELINIYKEKIMEVVGGTCSMEGKC